MCVVDDRNDQETTVNRVEVSVVEKEGEGFREVKERSIDTEGLFTRVLHGRLLPVK